MRNFGITFVFTIICHSGALLTLPSDQLKFLAKLFNVSINKVEDIASRFAFSTTVEPSDIEIIQYKSDGTKVTSLLSNLEGSEVFQLDLTKETVFIIHGYLSSGNVGWVKSMAEKYHQANISNTLAVNWNDTAARNYVAAAQATKQVGELVAEWLLNDLLKSKTKYLAKVHLVGHSLGTHVAGFIGKKINELTKGVKIGRITGLDPAGPLFETPIEKTSDQRFSTSDAIKVEAYHTNKGVFGYLKPTAQQDFYVNKGGPIQPICEGIWCSHEYSHVFFESTIGNSSYIAKKCDFALVDIQKKNYFSGILVVMGQNNNGTIEGVFVGFA